MRQNTNCLKKCCTLGTMLHIRGLHIGCNQCIYFFVSNLLLTFWVEISKNLQDKSKIMTCLPLKTGTTNWQKTLASIMVHEKTGRLLDPLAINDVFDDVPRYYTNFNQTYLNPSMNLRPYRQITVFKPSTRSFEI